MSLMDQHLVSELLIVYPLYVQFTSKTCHVLIHFFQLVKFAESMDICRHVVSLSVNLHACNFYWQSTFRNSPSVVISASLSIWMMQKSWGGIVTWCVMWFFSHFQTSFFVLIRIFCQICKYPDKTKRRKLKLSSKEYVSSQVTTLQRHSVDDDDPHCAALVAGPSRSNSGTHAGWKKRFRDGDDDNSIRFHSILQNAALTMNMLTSSIFSDSKRSGSGVGNDKSHTKKFKVAYPPPLGTFPVFQNVILRWL